MEKLKFDANGLITAVVQDDAGGGVLMVAWMNAKAIRLTQETGEAHFWSRSREEIWRKGSTSGNVMKVVKLLVDCDQDCMILKVTVDAGQCHVGYQSCFYRKVLTDVGDKMAFISKPVYDPDEVYKK